jgi:hypothetical protein
MRALLAIVMMCCFAAGTTTGARAWGALGHRIVNNDAVRSLPESVPAFLRTPAAIAEITTLGPEADRIKAASAPFDADNDPGHFLDLDDDGTIAGVVPLASLPLTRDAYDTAVRKGHLIEGHAPDQYRVGYLPYSIIDGYQLVVADFAIWRVDAYGEAHATDPVLEAIFATDRKLREDLILRDIGYWGHFIGDGSQPLHVSVHYNGWGDYPNPNNYTQSRTIHADFESKFVEAHATADLALPYVGAYVPSTQPISARVSAYLQATSAGATTVYRLTDAGAFAAATPEAITFTLKRLAAGAQMFRDLIADAYAASATATVGYPPVHVDHVLSGAVPPPSPIGKD